MGMATITKTTTSPCTHDIQVDNNHTRKVGLNDATQLKYVLLILFHFTNVYLYIIAIYNDMTACLNGGEGFRLGLNDVLHRSGPGMFCFLFIFFLLTYIQVIAIYNDMVRDGGCAHVEAGGWLQVAMSHAVS